MKKILFLVIAGAGLIALLSFYVWDRPRQTDTPASLADLPLIVQPLPAPRGKPLVVMVSGDGGWATMDQQMSQAFERQGYSFVGLDSLKYLWTAKTPAQASRDFGRILAKYQQDWDPPSILVVGFSKGADVLPFMLAPLPRAATARIRDVVLLSPQEKISFSIQFADWLRPYVGGYIVTRLHKLHNSLDLLPAVENLSDGKLLCVYGAEDRHGTQFCRLLDPQKYILVEMPGAHHFDENYPALVQRILQSSRAHG